MAHAGSDDRDRGVYGKFLVERTDGRSAPGEKHDGCLYFVLDLDHDPLALWPLKEYADGAWRAGFEPLAEDLWAQVRDRGLVFQTIPELVEQQRELRAQVEARFVELYGEDRENWPKAGPDR
jgi:hypothetical protein